MVTKMSDMPAQCTPLFINLLSENADSKHQDSLKRNNIFKELRCISGIPEIARQLSQDTVYKLVYTPEGGKLFKDAAGNIKGVFYKDGKIIEHAKFQAIRPSFIKAATAIGSQILLVSIAMQLNRIEEGISRIISRLHDNNIAEIMSGVSQYNQAMEMQDFERQSRAIEHAIQTLNNGIEKTVRLLRNEIKEAPDAKISFLDNWFTNKAKIASEKFGLAEESFKACLLGIKTLSECFIVINEPKAAASTLIKNLSNLQSCGIENAVKKARLVPFKGKGNTPPEASWMSFLKDVPVFINQINRCNLLANGEFDCIEIELKPIELLEN